MPEPTPHPMAPNIEPMRADAGLDSTAAARGLVERIFSADHNKDANAFVALLSQGATFRIGPMPPAIGRDQILTAVSALFAQMTGIEHHLEQLIAYGRTISYTASVRFSRAGRPDVELPYLNVLQLGPDGLIDAYTIDIDLSVLMQS